MIRILQYCLTPLSLVLGTILYSSFCKVVATGPVCQTGMCPEKGPKCDGCQVIWEACQAKLPPIKKFFYMFILILIVRSAGYTYYFYLSFTVDKTVPVVAFLLILAAELVFNILLLIVLCNGNRRSKASEEDELRRKELETSFETLAPTPA